MGCWATDSFGNDDAADWLAELTAGNDLAPVMAAVSAVFSSGAEYVEAPEATQVLAAAEVIAAALGRPGPAAMSQTSLARWLSQVQPIPEPVLVAHAVVAVERVLSEESELRDLWEDTEDYAEWKSDVEALLARLRA